MPSQNLSKPDNGTAKVPQFKSFKSRLAASRTSPLDTREPSIEPPRHGMVDASKAELRRKDRSKLADAEQKRPCNELFVEDRLGDFQNTLFARLDSRQIPAYRRYGDNVLLGTMTGLSRHSQTTSAAHEHIDSPGSMTRSYLSTKIKTHAKTQEATGLELLSCVEQSDDLSVLHDYISFEDSPHGSTPIRDGEHLDTDSPVNVLPTSDSTASDQKGPIADAFSPGVSGVSIRRTLRKRAENHPNSVRAWTDILANEKRIVFDSNFDGNTRLLQETYANVTIPIIEDALNIVKDSKAKEELLVLLMQQANIVWDNRKLNAQWERIIQEYPSFSKLWLPYLDFHQSVCASSDYEHMRLCFLRCLELSRGVEHGSENLNCSQEAIFNVQLHIALRLSRFEQEAGYTELALGQWQALLEYTILRPATHVEAFERSRSYNSDPLSDFELFWEGEAPRVGEEDAEGWAKWRQNVQAHRPTFGEGRPCSDSMETPTSMRAWASVERRATHLSYLPARTNNEMDDDDPYRSVLLSDVKPFLLRMPDGPFSSTVIDAFLWFCHLPPLPRSNAKSQQSSHTHDPFIQNVGMAGLNEFDGLTARFIAEQHTLFSQTNEWFQAFSVQEQSNAVDGWHPSAHFIMRVLDTFVEVYPDDECLMEYSAALRLLVAPDTVRKRLKLLIKKSPFDLRRYNTLILADLKLGRPADAEATLIKTLSNIDGFPAEDRPPQILLWRTCLWSFVKVEAYTDALCQLSLLALQDDPPATLHNLTPFTQPFMLSRSTYSDGPSETSVGKLLAKLASQRDHLLNLKLPQLAIVTAECLFLLTYCYDHSSLQAASKSLEESLSILQSHDDFFSETLHQGFARLLYHHSKRATIRLIELREHLETSMKAYPSNTMFIILYAQNERRLRIDDRLNSRVTAHLEHLQSRHPKWIVPHALLISCNLMRKNANMVTAEIVRRDFERALLFDPCRSCAGLWTAYFEFELAEEDAIKVESILHRAIGACPWAGKDLTLKAIERLYQVEDSVKSRKARMLYDLIEEWGCRFRAKLPDS